MLQKNRDTTKTIDDKPRRIKHQTQIKDIHTTPREYIFTIVSLQLSLLILVLDKLIKYLSNNSLPGTVTTCVFVNI